MNLDRFDEAKAVAERVFAQKLDGQGIHRVLLQIAYIQDDHAAQAKEIGWLTGKPAEFISLDLQSVNFLLHGQRRRAKELNQDASEMARRQGAAGAQSELTPPRLSMPGWVTATRPAKPRSTPLW
jgi:hypothetical protein